MKRNVKQNNRSVGAVYEQAAGYYLEQNGYELMLCVLRSEISFRQTGGQSAGGGRSKKAKKDFSVCAVLYGTAWN